MKNIIKFIKDNNKVLFGFALGILLTATTVYGATKLFDSENVGYDNTYTGFKDSNNQDVEDVQTALDELYTKANSCSIRNICPVGYKRIDGVNGEYSCVKAKSPETYIKSLNTEGDSIVTTDHYNELRFIGANPNNYVKFNNQVWRIIGVFEGKLKLVANPIGGYSWDTSAYNVNNGYGVNEWSQADLMKLLNPGYENNTDYKCVGTYSGTTCGSNASEDFENALVNNSLYWNASSGLCYNYADYRTTSCNFTTTGLKDTTSKNMIDNATWYLGSNLASDDIWGANQILTADYIYNMERSVNTGKQCSNAVYCSDQVTRTTAWTGKVGLIYPSDYAYATSGGTTTNRATCLGKQVGYVSADTTPNWSNTYTDCKDNNWLLNKSSWTWSLSPRARSSVSDAVFRVTTPGDVNDYIAMDAGSVRPVVYLKSGVAITRGDGTQSKPFELVLDE